MGIKILVVDDHEGIRKMLRRTLDGTDSCRVVGEASNGVDGVEKACELEPDVVIMDYRMPLMDGLDATQQIKSRAPGVDVVMYTSSLGRPNEAEMLARGASAVFAKDQIAELVEAIKNWRVGQRGT